MHNLLLASLVHWLNSDFYLLKILYREFFYYKLPLWEFKWIFISDHGELLGQISFLLKEPVSEWGLFNPLVVVRTTHIAQEFKPKWNSELIWINISGEKAGVAGHFPGVCCHQPNCDMVLVPKLICVFFFVGVFILCLFLIWCIRKPWERRFRTQWQGPVGRGHVTCSLLKVEAW